MTHPQVLIAAEPVSRGKSGVVLAPAGLRDVAGVLLVGGAILAFAGWVDVALLYLPPRFGESEWEFGVVAQTFDAFPLPTLGLILLAIGVRARGGRPVWPRALSIALFAVALFCLGLLVVFVLDVPVALRALERAAGAAQRRGVTPNPAVASGLKRGAAKAIAYSIAYIAAYATLALVLWRAASRGPSTRSA